MATYLFLVSRQNNMLWNMRPIKIANTEVLQRADSSCEIHES